MLPNKISNKTASHPKSIAKPIDSYYAPAITKTQNEWISSELSFTTKQKYNFEKIYGILKNNDPKQLHRFNCYSSLHYSNQIIIKEFGYDKSKETILIEFRNFPHIEHLLRLLISKFPQDWCHTIVCGNFNYDMIKQICDSICKNISSKITLIKLNINNITQQEYSNLLLTKEFWNNFEGEKLLIYQEDTLVFHGKITPFLEYDYIGAPWNENQNDNSNGVGNGGFSLRSKSILLKCLDVLKPSDLQLSKSTQTYMKSVGLTLVPEDVYFSKTIIDYKLGKVATRDIAKHFSQESVKGINPLGGHQFWLSQPSLLYQSKFKNCIVTTNYFMKCNHRSGWGALIRQCIDNKIIKYYSSDPQDILLIDSMEEEWSHHYTAQRRTFKKPWIGIIHYVDELPSFIKNERCSFIINQCKSSLSTCKGIITLSDYHKKTLQNTLKNINISVPIYTIKHPIEDISTKFNLNKFFSNNNHKLVQLGFQYRKISTIYTIRCSHKKIWLAGNDPLIEKAAYNALRAESEFLSLNPNLFNKVDITRLSNLEFDQVLLNNIVIIPLWNASANNSVLECIEMNIPAFITRLPSTEEYLGKFYPMFYSNIQEVEFILNNKQLLFNKYRDTYNYLLKLDKTNFKYEHFNSELLKIINN